jgi:hypothetical protein
MNGNASLCWNWGEIVPGAGPDGSSSKSAIGASQESRIRSSALSKAWDEEHHDGESIESKQMTGFTMELLIGVKRFNTNRRFSFCGLQDKEKRLTPFWNSFIWRLRQRHQSVF